MRADGSDVRILTDNPFEEATPGWDPYDVIECGSGRSIRVG